MGITLLCPLATDVVSVKETSRILASGCLFLLLASLTPCAGQVPAQSPGLSVCDGILVLHSVCPVHGLRFLAG